VGVFSSSTIIMEGIGSFDIDAHKSVENFKWGAWLKVGAYIVTKILCSKDIAFG
jgi:hypothetical protein